MKLPNSRSYLEAIAKQAGLYYHGKLEHDRVYTVLSAREMFERNGFDVTSVKLANMLPLTVPGSVATFASPLIWKANILLARIPGLRAFATNVEVIARVS